MPPKSFKPTREHKARKRARATEAGGEKPKAFPDGNNERVALNPNADIIVPGEQKKERPAQKAPEEPKMSAKKRKRYNKYIENKLRKDETMKILQKLGEQQKNVDTSLLVSSRSLGASRESKKQRIKRALLEEQAGLNSEKNKELLYEVRSVPKDDDYEEAIQELRRPEPKKDKTPEPESESDSESEEEEEQEDEMEDAPKPVQHAGAAFGFGLKSAALGSGLKRPFSDISEIPIIKKRKKQQPEKPKPTMIFMDQSDSGSDEEMPTDSESEGSEDSDEDGEGGEYEEWGGISDDEKEDGAEVAGEDSEDAEVGEEDSDEEGSEDEEDDDEEEEEDSDDDGDDSDEDGEEDEGDSRAKPGKSQRANAFKEWAFSQKKEVLGETEESKPHIELVAEASKKLKNEHEPRKREEDMTPPPELFEKSVERQAFHVNVNRPIEVQEGRLKLPVVAEEQRIMEAIHNNPCVVICGETGSGKTTQVPQFLYEAGYGAKDGPTPGLIGVTQPRRVAAVSMANRVGVELGEGGKEKVSYQIRFDGTVSPKTAIKFMTDGVLLRELAEDFLLRKYSAIIIDEAHERSINTDILIGVMSRVLRLRAQLVKEDPVKNKPLKMIIMSATLRVSDFVDNKTLFPKPPPLLKVDARQHPVTIHFQRRTPADYVEEAYKKVCRIHRRLPPGGILVFLTGQNEITQLMKRLRKTFPEKYGKEDAKERPAAPEVKVVASEAALETEDVEFGELRGPVIPDDDEDGEESGDDDDLGEEMGSVDVDSPLHVLPLYSLLPTKEQLRVFDEPPAGSRQCVVSTNIAETSLTIPGIRYVVDCGRSKERKYDKATGVQSFEIGWTSKASASQRAGRAGRTGPGHCYRLYSSAVYENDFEQFAEAELLRMPIEGVVLQMKAMNIDTIVNFPFPTPPDRFSLQKAEQLLGYLRALTPQGQLTELGKSMNIFPLSPRFAKVLIVGQQHECLPYVIAIVAALSVGDIFVSEHQLGLRDENDPEVQPDEAEIQLDKGIRGQYHRAHANFSRLDAESDALKLLSVVCAYEYESDKHRFCTQNFVRHKAMEEIHKLRQQITNIVMTNCPGILSGFLPRLPPPSKLQLKALKQIVAAGFIDNVAIRADLLPNSPLKLSKLKTLRDVPYVTLFPSSLDTKSEDILDQACFIHQSSVLYSKGVYPEYIVYSTLSRSNQGAGKTWMHPLTTIKGSHLAALTDGTPLLTYSKPLESKPPRMLEGGKKREVWVIPRVGAAIGRSTLGWPLPPQKIIQKREGLSQKWVKE